MSIKSRNSLRFFASYYFAVFALKQPLTAKTERAKSAKRKSREFISTLDSHDL